MSQPRLRDSTATCQGRAEGHEERHREAPSQGARAGPHREGTALTPVLGHPASQPWPPPDTVTTTGFFPRGREPPGAGAASAIPHGAQRGAAARGQSPHASQRLTQFCWVAAPRRVDASRPRVPSRGRVSASAGEAVVSGRRVQTAVAGT